jgi:hypothetical protein
MPAMRKLGFRLYVVLVMASWGCGPSAVPGKGGDGGHHSSGMDADGDGISDEDEGRATNTDTDGDGIPDYLDLDSDNDGIPDSVEAGDSDLDTPPIDSDGDGIPDFRDTDSDNNGRPDGVDGTNDYDGDGIPDYRDLDDDNDGINDDVELAGGNPMTPVDTDGDGIPDYHDLDSDNDTILDSDELVADVDMDGIPAFRDKDSDGDCIPDSIEAGDADLNTPPVDTDGDGIPDFLDLDSDNDGIPDRMEDKNCNGVVDPGETSRTNADTDGDGVSDLVEIAAGTDPTNPADNPQSHGNFVFEVPYMDAPSPTSASLDFSTNISQADVFFLMDTTGSMGGEAGQLKTSLGSIISDLHASIPNIGIGVGDYDDMLGDGFSCYGYGSDVPFELDSRVVTVTGAGLSAEQSAVNNLVIRDGGDLPESGWQALHEVATGQTFSYNGVTVPQFSDLSSPPVPIPAGESVGTIGGAGFRSGSLPIVVWVTDAESHNGDIPNTAYGANGCPAVPGAATKAQAISELNAIGAKVVAVNEGGNSYTDAVTSVIQTKTTVPPSAWPGGCAGGSGPCCTGLSGAGQPTDSSGQCPLDLTIDGSGNGLGSFTSQAIEKLTQYSTIDISASIANDPSNGSVDAVADFVDHLSPNNTAGGVCATGLTISGNGFLNVTPGTTVCFDVVPKENTVVMPTAMPQMFKAIITITGDNITVLDRRTVYFLVPPVIVQPPIG